MVREESKVEQLLQNYQYGRKSVTRKVVNSVDIDILYRRSIKTKLKAIISE